MNTMLYPAPFVKYGKIENILETKDIARFRDCSFQVTEKIDGGNCQVRKINGSLVAGSKANFLKGSKLRARPWFEYLNAWMHRNLSLYSLPENLVVFGEWSGNHSIDYGENNNNFFLLDLFDISSDRFIPYEEAVKNISGLGAKGMHFLPVLSAGKQTAQKLDELLESPSSYYPGHKEGLVLKDYQTGTRLKIYHPDFAENERLPDGTVNYLTPARFRKTVFDMVDKNRYAIIPASHVIDQVMADVYSEEKRKIEKIDVGLALAKNYRMGKLLRASSLVEMGS